MRPLLAVTRTLLNQPSRQTKDELPRSTEFVAPARTRVTEEFPKTTMFEPSKDAPAPMAVEFVAESRDVLALVPRNVQFDPVVRASPALTPTAVLLPPVVSRSAW
jgi:hypothetical protein